MKKGLFVTLEGGEGVGKTTLLRALELYFRDMGYPVFTTREPGGTELGENLRQLLLDNSQKLSISSRSELLILLAARVQHLEEKILPALQSGRLVFCDRFHDSTIAYQGNARGLGMEVVKQLCLLACQGVVPDLTFWLDLIPAEGMKRRKAALTGQTQLDRFELEKLDFHSNVYTGLKLLAEQEPQRIIRLDALLPVDQVAQIAIRHLEERLQRV